MSVDESHYSSPQDVISFHIENENRRTYSDEIEECQWTRRPGCHACDAGDGEHSTCASEKSKSRMDRWKDVFRNTYRESMIDEYQARRSGLLE